MASLACKSQLSVLRTPATGKRALALPVRPRPIRRSVAVQAAKLPAGVTAPPRFPEPQFQRFGWVNWAEKINGRAAMMGFFGILIVEAIAGKGFFEMLGLTVGNGLGFEF